MRVDVVDAGSSIRLLLLLLLPLLLLPMGTRLAPDTCGLGPFTELEKTDAVGLFLAYGQLAM